MNGFLEAYKNLSESGIKLVFGYRVSVCDDSTDKSKESIDTESKFVILARNDEGYKKLIIVTGKGSRSKVYNDPYRSKEMSILKYSVPDYIKQDEELSNLINKISVADIKEGGEGAISISLKN